MGHEAFVDVAYRGLEVGRRLRLREVGPRTAYVDVGTPMPVGSGLVIRTDDGLSIQAVVIRVHEQVAGADMPPGMRIRTEELEGAAAGWWRELVSRADPEIPEPEQPAPLALHLAPQAHDTAVMNAVAVADAAAELAAPGPGAPEQTASGDGAALPGAGEGEAAGGEGGNGASEDPHVLSASHTVVMSAVEISQITDLAGEEGDGEDDANPDDAGEREADGGNGAPGSNGDELQGGRGKRRRRRRR